MRDVLDLYSSGFAYFPSKVFPFGVFFFFVGGSLKCKKNWLKEQYNPLVEKRSTCGNSYVENESKFIT